jgi:hypothetical protein
MQGNGAEESAKATLQGRSRLYLALPNNEYPPSTGLQFRRLRSGRVPRSWRSSFASTRCGSWARRATLAVVPVPETPMNEDDSFPGGKYKIGTARKVFPMKPEAIAQPMRGLSDN